MNSNIYYGSNVSIGKSSDPAYTLDVNGDINFSGDLYQDGQPFISGSSFTYITEENANVIIGSNLTINSLGSNVLTVSGNISASSITLGSITLSASPFDFDDVVSQGNTTSNVIQIGGLLSTGNITSQNITLTNTDITVSLTDGTLTIDAKEKTYGTAPLVVTTSTISSLVYSNLITGAQIVVPILASGGAQAISATLTNVNFYTMTSDVSIAQNKHGLLTLSNLYGNIYMNAIAFS